MLALVSAFAHTVSALVHPIGIHGRYFIDTVTREPFFLKGVDYQVGGSSAVSSEKDPLSDPNACARDIILFQELGINAVRIYSVNPELDHDVCMTLLAAAGIYLVLDVNSPLENQHLNRYEPWTTYNERYLEHVFKIIDQFSGYNNTLGFFAGNEIVNDKKSAKNSPAFIKALITDMKTYISQNSPRFIPVGYSAADDLSFRISLSKYLECTNSFEQKDNLDSVDFYGVNTYQWCGEQTFYTSGYDVLVSDYEEYTRPVFFSEFGCNEVQPRIFEEINSIYSDDMVGVFSGGLVYEYSQEPNNYGLVEVDEKGNVKILQDFDHLKNQYNSIDLPTGRHISSLYSKGEIKQKLGNLKIPECEETYENLNVEKFVDRIFVEELIAEGVDDVKRGEFVSLKEEDLVTTFEIFNKDGSKYNQKEKYVKVTTLINQMTEYEEFKLRNIKSEGEYLAFDELNEYDEYDEEEEEEEEEEENDQS